MAEMKTLPLDHLIRYIYPDFYNIDCLFTTLANGGTDGEGNDRPSEKLEPPKLQLSAERCE